MKTAIDTNGMVDDGIKMAVITRDSQVTLS